MLEITKVMFNILLMRTIALFACYSYFVRNLPAR